MKAKITKKSTKPTALENVYVDIVSDERDSLVIFFSFKGMKKAFLDLHSIKHSRRHLDHAIETGSFRMELLKDVRAFVDEHKDEISEFIKDNAA